MKKNFFCAVSLLTCLGLHADKVDSNKNPSQPCMMDSNFQRGDDSLPKGAPCAPTYSPPASINLADKPGVGRVFLTASYLYWNVGEDGLDLASLNNAVDSNNMIFVQPPKNKGKVFYQNMDYQSGFKVGFGINQMPDDWVARLDYTYMRSNTHTSFSSKYPDVLYVTNWFVQVAPNTNQSIAAEHLSSNWHMGLDWLDGTLSRPFYQGRKLILNFFSGLRASWIRQSLNIKATELVNINPSSGQIESRNQSRSWGIGPRGGIASEWLWDSGVRVQGNAGGSLLFTQYTKIAHSETAAGSEPNYYPVSYTSNNHNVLRPMFEMGVGLGWGTYFCKQRCHVDLSADYDFHHLWAQNMMRSLNDQQIGGSSVVANALNLHGLTVNARFDF